MLPNRSPSTSRVAFFGSSLVSAYWNGAATYYRGILRALHERGHAITFYESDAYERQQHRDIDDPPYARVVVYDHQDMFALRRCLDEARDEADLVVKASGVGVHDPWLERAVADMAGPDRLVAFWDVDAPATLDRTQSDRGDPFRQLIPRYDVIFTYGGGQPVIDAYEALGARRCVPIYNAMDPQTHHPPTKSPPQDPSANEPRPSGSDSVNKTDAAENAPSRSRLVRRRFDADLAFLGNRLPDREARVEEFFFRPAAACGDMTFLLGGSGWHDKAEVQKLSNIDYIGHVYTADHNAFNASPLAVLNISRASMARYGFSPATRVFEAAGAGACLITDAWKGVEQFLEPGAEVLVAESGEAVVEHLRSLRADPQRARRIGEAALRRVLREHTYAHRAAEVDQALVDARENCA